MIDNGLNKNDVMSACSLIELKQIENRNKLNQSKVNVMYYKNKVDVKKEN